ncbi:hypothetical protein [Rhodococcus sp. 14-2470-1a]|uniref:hypothetical protein n=1 Tax=Rhodococcus sp. 14-2470-1a TaxID=2023150 RepID=UPI00211B0D6B|nr:hypothetical protein [Rhodococcus sp. 14-2470-1a]
MVEFVFAAQLDIRSYLYSSGLAEVMAIDPCRPDMVAMADAIAAELATVDRDTFTSPQRHSGHVEVLRQPHVTNRKSASETLPAGALWTATPLADDLDTWTESRESDAPTDTYELNFDPDAVHVVRIDSASDWADLLQHHPRGHSDTLYPDWAAIATHCDAVHLSLAGLLTAHPPLTDTAVDASAQGYAHSKSGPWAGVGDWSAVSTAWMRLPRNRIWRHQRTLLVLGGRCGKALIAVMTWSRC